jgi:hypothetical protein
VEDKSLPQRFACGDGRKGIREILELAQACENRSRRRGRGTGVSPETTSSNRGEGLVRPLCAFRKRASAVSAWIGARGTVLAGTRSEGVLKTSRRIVGAAIMVVSSSRRRLPSTMPLVVLDAKNQGVLMVPAGPSPGKPQVLSKRSSGPARSGTA